MTDRLRIPVPFGPDPGGAASIEEAQLVDNRVRTLEQGWRSWDTLVWDAVTTSPVLNNGSLKGWTRFDGRWLEGWVELSMGSSTTFGSGQWVFSGSPVVAAVSGIQTNVGYCTLFDTSAATTYTGPLFLDTSAALRPRMPSLSTAGTTSTVGAANPFTWASGDALSFWFKYRYRN